MNSGQNVCSRDIEKIHMEVSINVEVTSTPSHHPAMGFSLKSTNQRPGGTPKATETPHFSCGVSRKKRARLLAEDAGAVLGIA